VGVRRTGLEADEDLEGVPAAGRLGQRQPRHERRAPFGDALLPGPEARRVGEAGGGLGEHLPAPGQEQRARVGGVPQVVAVPPLLPGARVPRGARLVGADGQRRAPAQRAAQSGPLTGAQAEGAVGQDEVDPLALALVGRDSVAQGHVDDRVRGAGGEGEQRGQPVQAVVVAEQQADGVGGGQ
jgi:hypothetical protein